MAKRIVKNIALLGIAILFYGNSSWGEYADFSGFGNSPIVSIADFEKFGVVLEGSRPEALRSPFFESEPLFSWVSEPLLIDRLTASCSILGQSPCAPARDADKSDWFFGGHLESGLYVNQYGRKNSYTNGLLDPDSGNTARLQNVRQSDFQMNQLYLNFGKKLDSRAGFDIGGRIDFMYGTDALFVQSAGLERDAGHGIWRSGDYYTALPQLYFEVGYKNFTVKMGKFLSPMGEESILSTDRFFYSLSDAYGELPDTMTGVIGQWAINKRISVSGGWVNGENQTFDTGRDNAILGDVSYQLSERLRFGYAAMFNMDTKTRDDWRYYIQSFVVGYKGVKWDYTFEWILRNQKVGSNGRFGAYGINQELLYRVNRQWSLGVRAEWMHRYTKDRMGYDRYKITIGANWKPVKWLTVRPELRYDVSDGTRPFNKPKDGSPGGRKSQITGGVSTVIKF